jgi:deazaflavin-dependent oxidoreductase (nitroreductase family)
VAVKVPPRGKHGVPFPRLPSWLTRAFHKRQATSFRREHGGRTAGGLHTLLLETTGARTGERRSAMVGYVEDGPGAWLIIASLGGAARHPAWVYNIAHDPRSTIEFGDGRRVKVQAEILEGDELEAAWKTIAIEAPYPKYQSKTDRTIPVLRLRQVE